MVINDFEEICQVVQNFLQDYSTMLTPIPNMSKKGDFIKIDANVDRYQF